MPITRTILTALTVVMVLGLGIGGGTAIGRNLMPIEMEAPTRLAVLPAGQFPVSFQGTLVDTAGKVVPDGDHSVVFAIYDSAGGPTPIWQETQTITSTNGRFSTLLGLINDIQANLFANELDTYLGLKVGGDPEMSPRFKVAYAPYALFSLQAFTSQSADALDCSGCILQSHLGFDPTGDTGPQGIQGVKGDTGDTGPQGIQGVQGDTGTQGIQGVKGDTGDKGDTGSQGIQGVKGDKGDTGSQGIQGVKGDKGDTGSQGIQGVKGDTGDKGNTGSQGIQGVKGVKGDTGTKGNTGSQGPRGDTGTKGNTGSQGPRGDAGISGYEVVTKVSVNNSVAYKEVTVTCPGTKQVLGGGTYINTLTSLVATLDSRPTLTSPAGWLGSAGETAGDVGNWSLIVYAICANVSF